MKKKIRNNNGRFVKGHTNLNKKGYKSTAGSVAKSGSKNPMYGKKHSKEHKRKISQSMSGRKLSKEHREKFIGQNNPNWKGGISTLNDKARHNIEISLWKRSVFERDNFTCQKLGTMGGKLNAHHINNFAEYPELRTAIDNGITLSEEAHKEFHKKYGRKNNTKEQLIDFLTI